jgi:hypothetical protein
MTDDTMRDLVTKHDAVITQLVASVEHLVQSQTETNKRLSEISKFLAKQAVFSSKLEIMDRELVDSFNRVYARIHEVATIQRSPAGCNSVRLVTKDINNIARELDQLADIVKTHQSHLSKIDTYNASLISPSVARWIIGGIIMYSIIFGTYVVKSFTALQLSNTSLKTKLENEIRDTARIRRERFKYE